MCQVRLTLPLKWMSQLLPIHLAHASPQLESVDSSALMEDLLSLVGFMGRPKPTDLLCRGFNDLISGGEQVGKKWLSTMPYGRREEKQSGREEKG